VHCKKLLHHYIDQAAHLLYRFLYFFSNIYQSWIISAAVSRLFRYFFIADSSISEASVSKPCLPMAFCENQRHGIKKIPSHNRFNLFTEVLFALRG
jgi:hypothetical protein